MITIADLARDAIVAQNMLPAENVGIDDVVYDAYDGVTRIIIKEGDAVPDEYFDGPLTQTTPLLIECYNESRDEALTLCRQAATAVYRTLSILEHRKGSGILSIDPDGNGVKSTPDGRGFAAFYSFNVLNRINL